MTKRLQAPAAAVFLLATLLTICAQSTWAQAQQPSFNALSPEQVELLDGGLTDREADTLVDDFLERQARQYAQTYGFPASLVALFDSDPDIRNVFISAVDPDHDDIAKAAQILDELHTLDPDRLEKYVHLAVALAVVHDQPSRFHWELLQITDDVESSQFPRAVGYREVYDYYTQSPRGNWRGFSPDELPWPMLVYVVDNQVSADERAWARQNCTGIAIDALYGSVSYDDAKLNDSGTALGRRPYTLPNIWNYGGVCVEQAYFASRAAKSFGIPAMIACGENRYGGRHAWVGYLVASSRKADLVFSGRYFGDHYYTGEVYSPQTGQAVLDRHVAMMFDGVSVSYNSYQRSRVLFRMAEIIRQNGQQAESLVLTEYALTNNPYLSEGWRLLLQHFADGTLAADQAVAWSTKMFRALADHPDITFECLGTLIDSYAQDDFKNRQKMYQRAWDIYEGRPDLQFQLCLVLAREMTDAGKKKQALEMLLKAITRYSSEGSVILPATQLAVQYAKDLHVARAVYNELQTALAQFPQYRGASMRMRAYVDFKATVDSLLVD